MKPFTLEEIRNAAMRLDSRFDLGQYVIRGPRENLMELESRLDLSTVAAHLHHEGYFLVSPEQYAKDLGLTVEAVLDKVEKEGSLFALIHPDYRDYQILVPLPEREEKSPTE